MDENEFVNEVENFYGKRNKNSQGIDGRLIRFRDIIADSESGNGSGEYGRKSIDIYETDGKDTAELLFEQIVNSRGLINGRGNRVIALESSKVEDTTYDILGR